MAIPTPKFMQQLELEYQGKSGLRDRARYKIFYSQLVRADLLVLGINPGGDPKKPEELMSASTTYYENWEHDYVDCVDPRYTLKHAMFPFLKNILNTNKEAIRLIPKTNLIFRRSPGVKSLPELHDGMTITEAMKEASPTIEQIMRFVQPKMVLLEGTSLRDKFKVRYCSGQLSELAESIKDKYRGQRVNIFTANNMHVNCLGRELPVVAIGHPSHFGDKPAWGSVQQATRSICERFNVRVKSR
jgi:hypothetical protein